MAETMDHLLRAALVVESHHHEASAILLDARRIAPEGSITHHAAFIETKVWTAEHPYFIDLTGLDALDNVEFLQNTRVIGQHIIAMSIAKCLFVVLDGPGPGRIVVLPAVHH